MALQTSGPISLNQIHVEAGGSSGTTASLNDADIRGLIGKSSGAQMSFNEWYGAANTFTYTISSNTQELNLTSTYFTNVGWNGSSNIILTIGSGVYIWSDNTATAGMTIASSLNGKLTIVNNGYIIGKGGAGGINGGAGAAGGSAISNSATGIIVTNASGAYIAGGGGGGGSSDYGSNDGGGGGGAGGGAGGASGDASGGSGGSIGAAGSTGVRYSWLSGSPTGDVYGYGGGSGGGGGYRNADGARGGGGGGGRILPGTGGVGGDGTANGGSAGNNGTNGITYGGGGGGGWGATGGTGWNGGLGGAGGAAISGTAVTLTNNGTIYGTY